MEVSYEEDNSFSFGFDNDVVRCDFSVGKRYGYSGLNVTSKYAAIICYENGQLMTSKDAELPTSPAAGVKLMTALLV